MQLELNLPAVADCTICVTQFKATKTLTADKITKGILEETTWAAFAERLQRQPFIKQKNALALIKLACYPDNSRAAGAAPPTTVCGLEFDYDDGAVSPHEALRMFQSKGVAAVIVSSYNCVSDADVKLGKTQREYTRTAEDGKTKETVRRTDDELLTVTLKRPAGAVAKDWPEGILVREDVHPNTGAITRTIAPVKAYWKWRAYVPLSTPLPGGKRRAMALRVINEVLSGHCHNTETLAPKQAMYVGWKPGTNPVFLRYDGDFIAAHGGYADRALGIPADDEADEPHWTESASVSDGNTPYSSPVARRAANSFTARVWQRFNQENDLRQILQDLGYVPAGDDRYYSPNQSPGNPAARIMPPRYAGEAEKVYHHNNTDNGAHGEDAFSLVVKHHYHGDTHQLVRDIWLGMPSDHWGCPLTDTDREDLRHAPDWDAYDLMVAAREDAEADPFGTAAEPLHPGQDGFPMIRQPLPSWMRGLDQDNPDGRTYKLSIDDAALRIAERARGATGRMVSPEEFALVQAELPLHAPPGSWVDYDATPGVPVVRDEEYNERIFRERVLEPLEETGDLPRAVYTDAHLLQCLAALHIAGNILWVDFTLVEDKDTVKRLKEAFKRYVPIIKRTNDKLNRKYERVVSSNEAARQQRLKAVEQHSRQSPSWYENKDAIQEDDSVLLPPQWKDLDPESGLPLLTIANVQAVADSMLLEMRFNDMTHQPELLGGSAYLRKLTPDALSLRAFSHATLHGMRVGQPAFRSMFDSLYEEFHYHPVEQFMRSVEWDGKDHIRGVAERLVGTTPLESRVLYLTRWLVGGIQSVLAETPKAQQIMLVLQGPQGTGKTTFFANAAMGIPNAFNTVDKVDMSNRDNVMLATSSFITEMGEVERMSHKHVEDLRAFITKPDDRYRAAYARNPVNVPRRTVLGATVNPDNFLNDREGNRRTPVINVGTQIHDLFGIQWDQVWAQARHLWQAGERFAFSPDEIHTVNREADNYRFRNLADELLVYYLPPANREEQELLIADPSTLDEVAQARRKKLTGQYQAYQLRQLWTLLCNHAGATVNQPGYQSQVRKYLADNGYLRTRRRPAGAASGITAECHMIPNDWLEKIGHPDADGFDDLTEEDNDVFK